MNQFRDLDCKSVLLNTHHELRQLHVSIRGYIQLSQSEKVNKINKEEIYLEMEQNMDKLGSIVNDLLLWLQENHPKT